ncbi:MULTISPECIES: hypothetical protein [unclassified Sphingomonas]|uniref:hypothetical protein n=1 Tax=unclassified Sphingomonas TaxID=196159 RepID=UPI0012E10453|nr:MULTISPECIES: hypothetical protein [unclassified Sphingomonas]
MTEATEAPLDTAMRRDVERGSSFQYLSADTAIVERVHDAVSISFLIDSIRPSGVVWDDENAQPSRVGRRRVIEELASVRMTPDAANALAMDILLELASLALSTEVLEKNFAIVRSAVEERMAKSEQDNHDG